MKRIAFSPSLQTLTLIALASLQAGCTTSVWEQISPDPRGYYDSVDSVEAAYRRDDGNIVICVTGNRAAPPPLAGELAEESFSLILPEDAGPHVAIDDDHASLRRYDLTSADVAEACQEIAGAPLPVHAITSLSFEYPAYHRFNQIPDSALVAQFDSGEEPQAVYVFTEDGGYLEIIYVGQEARFDGARAVLINRRPRPVEGSPGYVVLLPFTVVFDAVVTLPLLLFMKAIGYDG